jgi:hypothetical protein
MRAVAVDARWCSGRLDGRWCVRETPVQPRRRLLDQVRDGLRPRHYSRRTERAYVAWIRRYILFHGKRHPAEMLQKRGAVWCYAEPSIIR